MCYRVRFITRSVKCIVTTRWMMEWLGNGFGCSMKDDRTCTMRCEVGVHFGWMMIWWVRSTRKFVTTDVSEFLIRLCNFLRFQGLYSITLSAVIWIIGKCVHDRSPRCSQRSTETAYCTCFDISEVLSQGRSRHVEPYCDRRRDMGVRYHTWIKTAVIALEA